MKTESMVFWLVWKKPMDQMLRDIFNLNTYPWFEPTTYILSHKTTKIRDQNEYSRRNITWFISFGALLLLLMRQQNASKVGVLLDVIKWSGKNLNQPLTFCLKYADILNILKTSINKIASYY